MNDATDVGAIVARAKYRAFLRVLGVLSHLPGGIGVFEAVMLLALHGVVPPEALAAALFLYRLLYYAAPLAAAAVLLVVVELGRPSALPVRRAMLALSPSVLAALTLGVGLMLLVSGATPVTDEATDLLALHVPLPLVEAAHFLGSIAGLALLFVAHGMLRRLDAAWWTGLVLATLSLLFALPKGIAVGEAIVLAGFVALLAASRRQFYRRAALGAQALTRGWTLAVAGILLALGALTLFAYRDVAYTHELWWQFEFDGHAPRSLRALVAAALLLLVLAFRQLLRPAAPSPPAPDQAGLERAMSIVRAQPVADAGLALMGDKRLLFAESGRAFVMFGCYRRSWIALFDPIGPAAEAPGLIWQFLEHAREVGARPSFYQVRPEYLPHYLDAGLTLLKLGEHAAVALPGFSLAGPRRANLRHGLRRAERAGLSFEIIDNIRVPALLDEMQAISDAWLARHPGEKGFSLGAFDPIYLARQPLAVARVEGRMVAFANLLVTDTRDEVSVDLMRHSLAAPGGTMDFLFANLLLHFQAVGYRWFSLGMAPLSGMSTHPLASNWQRLGRLLFAHGEHFYNFQGLRAFKEKFDPVWQPRYLAALGGVAPLLVLADTAALISGGLRAAQPR